MKQIITKKQIFDILLKENKRLENKGYKRVIGLFELKRLDGNIGVVNGEYHEEGQIIYSGSIIYPLDNIEPDSIWRTIKVDKTKYYGALVVSKKEGILKMMFGFFQRSLKQGKIQDFVK
ncbi:MAG TPA: hypothetical protein VJB94_02330 [Candidatus Nanoarchaeia archaeon]|nr:hypothetical protein [Candidatus Nanoarchaeia archaeon]